MCPKLIVLSTCLLLAVGCSKISSGGNAGAAISGAKIVSPADVFGDQNMDAIIAELEALRDSQDATLCTQLNNYAGGDATLKAELESELQITCP